MKIKKIVWLVVLAALFVAAILPSVGVGATEWTEIPFEGREYLLASTEGEETFPGGNYHVRGGTHETFEVANNPCIDGPGFVTVMVNINKNGKIKVGGKFNIDPVAYEGGWNTMWHVNEEGLIVGDGHGVSELAGAKITYVFDGEDGIEDGVPYMDYSGTLFIPPNASVQCTE